MANYATITGRSPEFRIRYRWMESERRGATGRPSQYVRTDFLYAVDDPSTVGISMIWPEFESEIGIPLAEGAQIPEVGTATMWIVDPQNRSYHASRLAVGVRAYLVRGSNKLAEAEVIEILDLPTGKSGDA